MSTFIPHLWYCRRSIAYCPLMYFVNMYVVTFDKEGLVDWWKWLLFINRCSHHLPMVKPGVLIILFTIIIFTIITIICTIITTMITCSWSSPVFSAISSHSGFASPSPISLSLVQALKNKKSIFLTAVSQWLIESLKAFKTETHPSQNIPSLQIIQLTSRRS